MFLVTDLTIKPEPDDIERGWVDEESVVHLKVEDALTDLEKRIRFSLGYEQNEDHAGDDPPLRWEDQMTIGVWRTCQPSNPKIRALRIDTRDYQHLLIPLASLA